MPNKVQCNGFIIELAIAPARLKEKALALAENEQVWLFDRLMATARHTSRFETQIGDARDDWTDIDYVNTLVGLL